MHMHVCMDMHGHVCTCADMLTYGWICTHMYGYACICTHIIRMCGNAIHVYGYAHKYGYAFDCVQQMIAQPMANVQRPLHVILPLLMEQALHLSLLAWGTSPA